MDKQAQTSIEGQTLVATITRGSDIVAHVDSSREDEIIRALRSQPPGEYRISDWRVGVTVKSGGRLVYSSL